MVGGIWWNYWSMSVLFLLISILGIWEFFSLLERSGNEPQKIIGTVLLIVCLSCFFAFNFVSFGNPIFLSFCLLMIAPLLCLLFFIELFRKKEKPFQNVAYTFLGLIYIPSAFALLALVSYYTPVLYVSDVSTDLNDSYKPYVILGFFFLVWSNDTFAYLVGRTIGRTKLFERVSPNKTWEGTIGGVILTQGTAWVLSIYFNELSLTQWMVCGLIVSITATLGDLVESMFKRSLGVKDSGSILPGHGGILDRFDGVLLSAPFVCTYLMLIR